MHLQKINTSISTVTSFQPVTIHVVCALDTPMISGTPLASFALLTVPIEHAVDTSVLTTRPLVKMATV